MNECTTLFAKNDLSSRHVTMFGVRLIFAPSASFIIRKHQHHSVTARAQRVWLCIAAALPDTETLYPSGNEEKGDEVRF
uniref:Uncharacterized protein n=1 Tax=Syphacia muris TaxID=451379 RepID=A0A0N5API5_9BILA